MKFQTKAYRTNNNYYINFHKDPCLHLSVPNMKHFSCENAIFTKLKCVCMREYLCSVQDNACKHLHKNVDKIISYKLKFKRNIPNSSSKQRITIPQIQEIFSEGNLAL